MTIVMNKEYTTIAKAERTRRQMKEFREMYTDGDLLRMFRDATDTWQYGYSDEILYCKLSAFPGGTQETDETHYSVDMLLEGFQRYTKIHFYISQSCEIDLRLVPIPMWSIETYSISETV